MRHSVLVVLSLALGAQSALAHGGQYTPPPDSGGPGGAGNVGAPPTNPSGASTPTGSDVGSSGPRTRGDDGRDGGRDRPGPKTQLGELGDTTSDWESWWNANKDRYLDLRQRSAAGLQTQGPGRHISGFGRHDAGTPTRRPDQSRIDAEVVPFLSELIGAGGERDVIDSSVLAMARASRAASAETVIAATMPLLAHGELSVQSSATLSLGVLGSPLAVEALTALMSDSSAGRTLTGGRGAVPSLVRSFAALSLGLLNDERSVAALCELIDKTGDQDRDLKACALVALGLMDNGRSPDATRFLVGQLADRKLDAVLKSYVPTSIGKLCSRATGSDPSVLPALLDSFLGRDTDAMVRQSLAIALGQLGDAGPGPVDDSPVVQALMDYVTAGKDAATRQFCLIALAQIGGRDEDPSAHAETQAAIQHLLAREITKPSTTANRPWATLAAALYGREQPDVRADLAQLVSQAYASEKNPSVRAACALALGLLDVQPMAETIFDDFRRGTEPTFKGYAAIALGFLGYAEAADALHAECRAKTITPSYRMQVATALGLLGDRQAVGILSETLGTAQTLGVSAAVAKALGLIGDESAIAPLMSMASDTERGTLTRAFACVALGMVCEKSSLPWNAAIMANNNYNVAVPAIAEVCDIL